jgi:EAL domain-containing protein (putative c-di-GMP-specific phosphodiesterase class I)
MHTVLVVDDTREVRRTIRRILVRDGYEVVCAEDGAEALEIAARRELHAAVVDYQMPSMDGLVLLSRLRELHPGAVRLLISGALDIDIVMDAVNRGDISGVLHKPFDPAVLAAAIGRGIQHRSVSSQSWMASQDLQSQLEERELRRLLHGGLFLGLQPIVDSVTRRPVAFEGLIRSSNPVLPSPLQVIAAAEAHHLVGEVTRVVAREASAWLTELPTDIRLFLNLHPDELEYPDRLLEALRPVSAHASRVVLEITERRALSDQGNWVQTIAALRAAGFLIAVDDLGAGASSLAALAQIDPDVIKIDMSLIRGIDTDPRKQRLVDVVCRFAAASNVQVVAEGIETQGEARSAQELGANLLQGYAFGRAETGRPTVLRQARAVSLPPPPPAPRTHSSTRRRALARSVPDLDQTTKKSG